MAAANEVGTERMKTLILIVVACSAFLQIQAQTKFVPVFTSGMDGYKSYRIPALIRLPDGDLLAFAEGRVHGAGDFGDIDIVMKRSSDNGASWSALQCVAENDTLQAGNPAPVVDPTDPEFPQGRIFLFYNTGNNLESEVRKGKGYRQVWYKTSSDGGRTWSRATDITLQVHRPKQPELNPAYNFSEDWRTYANTPGHAMQFQSGKYRGTIFVAANHSAGDPRPQYMDYDAHGFYTHDHGKTFHLGASLNVPGSNESTAAELSGGRLMMNSRNQKGDIKARIVSLSNDGGETWDTSYVDRHLPDPVCQGSILTIGKNGTNNILAFCNPADEQRRDNLTVRISYDDGRSWGKSIVVDNSGDEQDRAAYSDIAKMSDTGIGVLYEKNNYSQIVFTIVNWKSE